jgi:predicted exporter
MSARRAWAVAAWLLSLAGAAWVALHARYAADLSAFLPARPTAAQRLLVDQLRDGPGSRLLLIALEGGDIGTRAQLSAALAQALRSDAAFLNVGNGAETTADRDREFLFAHRYLLSEAVTPQHFTAAGLRESIQDTVADLASPGGLVLQSLVVRDPTGEMLAVIDQLSRTRAPRSRNGVWTSADGARTLLIAETAASGSDTDAQEHALAVVRSAFEAAVRELPGAAARELPGASAGKVELVMSGPGVFAVASRARIEHAVVRLSMAGSALVAMILLAVYRSWSALVLGLLPVASGALVGVAAVALGFGVVHGITLGFGITLIGEAVDYSIYFFIQSAGGAPGRWERRLWPTMRLGMLTSVCGFASLLPSGFPGLAQLGAYSVAGLVAAAAVTRFVLPALLPHDFPVRDLDPAGSRIAHGLLTVRGARAAVPWLGALCLAAVSIAVLFSARHTLWNRELSSLSPIPPAQLRLDAELRADLGAPDSLDLIVVPGASLDAALRGAEAAAQALEPLIAQKVIGGFDTPAVYLPSSTTQAARRASLPDPATLARNLDRAARDLPLDAAQLGPFKNDVETARLGPLIGAADLEGTSMASGLEALTLHSAGGWSALLPLHAADPSRPDIDIARVRLALAAAHSGAEALDLKRESDALYSDYLREAMRLTLAGFAAIVVLLGVALRSFVRAARVLAPLVLAVLVVAAALALLQVRLTILHLVGMLLIVAIGSNYALFFDSQHRDGGDAGAILASLCIANACTVIGFGLLCFSRVPVLEALGATVAPGALLALAFSALLTPVADGERRLASGHA